MLRRCWSKLSGTTDTVSSGSWWAVVTISCVDDGGSWKLVALAYRARNSWLGINGDASSYVLSEGSHMRVHVHAMLVLAPPDGHAALHTEPASWVTNHVWIVLVDLIIWLSASMLASVLELEGSHTNTVQIGCQSIVQAIALASLLYVLALVTGGLDQTWQSLLCIWAHLNQARKHVSPSSRL